MKRTIVTLGAAALLLAPAAGAVGVCTPPSFANRTAFQSYVAGFIHVRSVSCTKLDARVADCLGSNHHRYVVACAKATGDSCVIKRIRLVPR